MPLFERGRSNDCDAAMTEKDYCIIIGVKEAAIYELTNELTQAKKELEAARAQLKGLARDGNDTL